MMKDYKLKTYKPILPKELLGKFYVNDVNILNDKLFEFIKCRKNGIHLNTDFDLTITSGINQGENVGSWDVFDVLMPAEGVQKHREIYNTLRPIEVSGKLTNEIAIEKWTKTLDLICSYKLSIDDVERAFLSVAKLRDGVKSVFDTCNKYNIPTVILSAGIINVIEVIARYYDIKPDYALSTHLIIDDRRRIIGWRKDTLIHMLNKKEIGHKEIVKLRKERPKIFLIGDVPHDAQMVEGDDDVIRVRVLEQRLGENIGLKESLKITFDSGYDLAVNDDLTQLSKLIEWIYSFDISDYKS